MVLRFIQRKMWKKSAAGSVGVDELTREVSLECILRKLY